MPFWRLYYHLVWSTKDRLPLITENIEKDLVGYIAGKSDFLGCQIQALGCVENHIHIVVSIPPTIAVADYISKIKGASSHHVNHQLLPRPNSFRWQEGYGAFSISQKQLKHVVEYVVNQKEHHRKQTLIPIFEQQ